MPGDWHARRISGQTAPCGRSERQCDGVLLPDFVLEFDDPDLAGITVADVLADPDKYVGETLADPLEGVDYGRCKAKIMRRANGSVYGYTVLRMAARPTS